MSTLSYKGEKYELTFQEFFPFFFNSQWMSEGFYDEFEKLGGFKYKAVSYHPTGLQLEKYTNLEKAKAKAQILADAKKESPEFFISHAKEYKKQLKRLENLVEKFKKINWREKTNQDISSIFLDFHRKIEVYNAFSNFYYIFSLGLESLLRENWKDENENDIQETFRALATPYLPSASKRFSVALKKASVKCKQTSSKDKGKAIESEAKKLSRDFFWFTSFSSPARTPESFIRDIEHTMQETGEEIPRLKLSVPKGWVTAMSVATYVKDDISTYFIPWYWHSLLNLWESIRERVGLKTKEELWYFSYKEIAEMLDKNEVVIPEQLKDRQIAIISEEGGCDIKIRIGEEAKDFF